MATLNGTTLPTRQQNPKGGDGFTGKQERSHNGTMLLDYTNLSHRTFTLEFKRVTASDYSTLWGLYILTGSLTYVTPEGDSYTVVVKRGSWRYTAYKYSTVEYYDVEFEAEEAS